MGSVKESLKFPISRQSTAQVAGVKGNRELATDASNHASELVVAGKPQS